MGEGIPKMTKLKKNVRLKSLEKQYQPRSRKDFIDYDYKDLLDEKEEEFLAQFTDEYYGGAVHKRKNGQVKAGYLHKTKEQARDCYKRNNDMNNDVMGVNKANSLLSNLETELKNKDGWYITNSNLTEDALISQLAEKQADDSLLTREEFEEVRDQLTPEMLLFYLSFYDLD